MKSQAVFYTASVYNSLVSCFTRDFKTKRGAEDWAQRYALQLRWTSRDVSWKVQPMGCAPDDLAAVTKRREPTYHTLGAV